MKRNTYTSIIRTLGCLLLLPVFASSCIHEDPELTADGEIGVDPTAVNIMTNLILETPFDPIDISRNTRAEEETEFLHRFTVSAYEGTQKVASQVIFQKVQTGETTISTPASIRLPYGRTIQVKQETLTNSSTMRKTKDLSCEPLLIKPTPSIMTLFTEALRWI